MPAQLDSNLTGLRYANELIGTPGTLPGSDVWHPLDPNSYGDFGATVETVKRDPINASRQNRKGTLVTVDAAAAFQMDFTQEQMFDLMQGFFFADWRLKTELIPTAVSGTQYTVPSGGTGFLVNSLLFGFGFAVTGNNGLHGPVTASTGTTVSAPGLATETPPATCRITRVGHQGASGDITWTFSGGVMTLGATTLNFTTLGLIPGEWIRIGGDAAGEQYTGTPLVNGFARIKTIAATAIVIDIHENGTPATDTGAAKTIRLWFGHVIKNESSPALIKIRTYQFERYLADAAIGYEYLIGSFPNTLEFNMETAAKITGDLAFVSLDRTSLVSPKAGTRPTVLNEEVFNTSNDFARLRLAKTSGDVALFTYATELKLTIDNKIKTTKALGNLAAIGATSGNFTVEGSVEAYFTSDAAVTSVRANDSCSLDFGIVKANAGWYVDLPHLTLGDGRLKVEKDEAIKLPLNLMAVSHGVLDHTLLMVCYRYLPTAA